MSYPLIIREGASGDHVRTLQRAINGVLREFPLAQPLRIDGQFGPRTSFALGWAQMHLGYTPTGVVDETNGEAFGFAKPVPSFVGELPIISSWGWYSSDTKIREWVAAAKRAGGALARIRVMVNGTKLWLNRAKFYLNKAGQRWRRIVEIAHAAGVGVDFTTWITPFESFLRESAQVLVPIVQEVRRLERQCVLDQDHPMQDMGRLCELDFDAEGLWSKPHRKALSHTKAAELVAEVYAPILKWITVSFIVAGAKIGGKLYKKLKPLVDVCAHGEPQCYYDDPDPTKCLDRTRKAFGAHKVISMGGRAYHGASGWSTQLIVRDYKQAVAANVREVCYWKAGSLLTRRFINALVEILPERQPVEERMAA